MCPFQVVMDTIGPRCLHFFTAVKRYPERFLGIICVLKTGECRQSRINWFELCADHDKGVAYRLSSVQEV